MSAKPAPVDDEHGADPERVSSAASTPAEVSLALAWFNPRESMAEEMQRLGRLRQTAPSFMDSLLEQAQTLVSLAASGHAEAIRDICGTANEGELLMWGTQRMFLAACEGGHTEVVRLMLRNGVTAQSPGLDRLFPKLVAGVEGTGAELCAVLQLLARAGFDANAMRREGSDTAMHVACRRTLLPVFKALVLLKVDLNAVNDSCDTPLKIARERVSSAAGDGDGEGEEDARQIASYLARLGAKEDWRSIWSGASDPRPPPPPPSVARGPAATFTMSCP